MKLKNEQPVNGSVAYFSQFLFAFYVRKTNEREPEIK